MAGRAVSAGTLRLETVDAATWDAFVAAHPHGHLLQLSAWGQLKATAGWVPQLLGLHDRAGQLVAGAQLLVRRRFGVAAAYTPRGPLFSGDAAIDRRLVSGLVSHARRQLAVFLRLEPNLTRADAGATDLAALLQTQRLLPVAPVQPAVSLHVPLAGTPETLLRGVSKGHRADIRRAERDGVVVRVGTAADLVCFYQVMQETAGRAGFGIHDAGYYAAALRVLGPRVRLWLAERDGVPHAAAFTALGPHAAAYLYSGSTAAGLRSGAQHAIQWAALQWAQAAGARDYDLWGVPAALADTDGDVAAQQDPLYGVYRFKRGFGGRLVCYVGAYDAVLLPPLYHWWRRRMTG